MISSIFLSSLLGNSWSPQGGALEGGTHQKPLPTLLLLALLSCPLSRDQKEEMGLGEMRSRLGHQENEGEKGHCGGEATPVKSLLALSHRLGHSKIHSVTQPRTSSGMRAEKNLRDYFIFSKASCLVDEASQGD